MNPQTIIARARNVLLEPRKEWPVIAAEPATVQALYRDYICVLAALPAIAGFVKGSLIGTSVPLLGTLRVGFFSGLVGMLVSYALTLAMLYVLALVIDALAPHFGGRRDPLQALKTVAYAYTAAMLAGVAQVLPWVGGLIVLAGAIYSIYLLYLALPVTMQCPQEQAGRYTAVSVLAAFVLGWVIALTVGAMVGGSLPHGDSAQFDADSPMGQLESWTRDMEKAQAELEAAQRSGDAAAEQEAMGAFLGAAFGGGQVEALAPERLREFVPEELAGRERATISAERNAMMGLQVSSASAQYGGNGRTLDLEITDMGGARGLAMFAGWAGIEQEQVSDNGYERTFQRDGRTYHEAWDASAGHGERAVILGGRFLVKVTGSADDDDELADALEEIDLDGLEELRGEGVRKE